MHAGRGEPLERRVRLVRVVDDAGDDHRGGAVLEQVDTVGEPFHSLVVAFEEVVDRPGDAVALRLAGDDHRVELEQPLDQRDVPLRQHLAVRPLGHLRAEHRVVLGERMLALHLEVGLAVAGDPVEEERLLDRGDESVADSAEQRVVRPDRQVVLPALGEPARVVRELARRVLRVDAEALGGGRVEAPAAGLDVFRRDERVRVGVIALLVDEPDGVEDLHRPVRVEAGTTCVIAPRLRYTKSQSRRLSSTAPSRSGRGRRARSRGRRTCSGRRRRAGRCGRHRPRPGRSRAARPTPVPRGHAPRRGRARPRRPGPAGRTRAPAIRAPRASLVPGLRIRAAMPMSTVECRTWVTS